MYINRNGNIESIHVSIFTVAPKHDDVQPHVRHSTFDWLLSPTSTDDHADNDTDDEADE